MTAIAPELLQQLCAWMDGELPDDQARFLQRRLEGDPALRAQWERWQLASACLRGQPVRRMPVSLAEDIASAIASEVVRPSRATRWPWLAAAAVAVFAAVLLPRVLIEDADTGLSGMRELASQPEVPVIETRLRSSAPVSPVDAPASVRDFPLAETTRGKPWPRSPLAPDPRSMEAYLVRHNALMAEDGLAGFMPYVDVVAHESVPAAPAEGNTDP